MTVSRHTPIRSQIPSTVEPLRIQLAVQGGGARLSLLLGAMQAVQNAEQQNGAARAIRVTRFAGTSAGALAAALLAVGHPIDDVRATLLSHRAELETMLQFPSPAGMAWRAYRGRPIVDLAPIRQKLGRFFATRPDAKEQRQLRFSDLTAENGYRPLAVVASDVVAGGSHTFSVETTPDESIVNALMASIAVPFLFQSHATSPGQPLLVDGGLCENLPIDALVNYCETDGPVVAIALVPFAHEVSLAPTSSLRFAQSLLDTAIRHAVTRARKQISPDQVIELPTNLGTFDFPRGLADGLNELYTQARTRTYQKLMELPVLLDVPVPAVVDQQRPRELEAIQEAISRVYASQHEQVTYYQAEVRLTVRIGVVREDQDLINGRRARDPDTLWHRIDFWPDGAPIGCLRMNVSLTDPEDEQAIALRDIRLTRPDGEAVPHEALLARDPKGPTDRMFLYFPTPPLASPGPRPATGSFFQFRNHQTAPGAMSPLFEDGVDTLGVATIRASAPVPFVRIIVMVPQAMRGVECQDGRAALVDPATGKGVAASAPLNPGRALSAPELEQLGLQLEPGYYPIGWVATDVPPNTRLAVTLH